MAQGSFRAEIPFTVFWITEGSFAPRPVTNNSTPAIGPMEMGFSRIYLMSILALPRLRTDEP